MGLPGTRVKSQSPCPTLNPKAPQNVCAAGTHSGLFRTWGTPDCPPSPALSFLARPGLPAPDITMKVEVSPQCQLLEAGWGSHSRGQVR